MLVLPKDDPIKYLVYIRHPELVDSAKKVNGLFDARYKGQEIDCFPVLTSHEWPKLSVDADKYRQELLELDNSELQRLYHEAVQEKYQKDDLKRFFHEPKADADIDYWSKMPEWSVEEAVVLSFGKSPNVVTWPRLEAILSYTSPFVEKCLKLKELVIRAKNAKLFSGEVFATSFDPIKPYKYVEWVKKNNIDFPVELAQKVMEAYENNKPPKTPFEQSMDDLQEMRNERQNLAEKTQKFIEKRQSAKPVVKVKSLHTKERETLLKMVIGMAVKGYVYKPDAKRNTTSGEIKQDLELLGISLDEDTIRRWLKEASEFLPPQSEDI